MNKYKIALLTGDGAGPVLAQEAEKLLAILGGKCGFGCETVLLPFGRAAYEQTGTSLPDETVAGIQSADAALVAAVVRTRGRPLLRGQVAARDHGAGEAQGL